MTVILVMADYGCHPVWRPGADQYNVDAAALPISGGLAAALDGWAEDFDATLVVDDPAASGFSSEAAESDFVERGALLAGRLAAELGGDYQVEYHDVRTGRRSVHE